MIPAGYVSALVTWATLPTLDSEEKTARQHSLVAEFEALVTGQVTGTGKTGQALTSASANGKSFTFDPHLTKADKIAALSAAMRQLGLTSATSAAPTVTYADFSKVIR